MDQLNPWDECASGWDEDLDVRAYAAAASESLVARLDDRGVSLEDARVCDCGCGTGLRTERTAGTAQSIDAVDTSPAMLARLSAKIRQHEWTNVRGSIVLPESTETHHPVVCSSVLGLVEDYPGTVERLSGLLAQGGCSFNGTGSETRPMTSRTDCAGTRSSKRWSERDCSPYGSTLPSISRWMAGPCGH